MKFLYKKELLVKFRNKNFKIKNFSIFNENYYTFNKVNQKFKILSLLKILFNLSKTKKII